MADEQKSTIVEPTAPQRPVSQKPVEAQPLEERPANPNYAEISRPYPNMVVSNFGNYRLAIGGAKLGLWKAASAIESDTFAEFVHTQNFRKVESHWKVHLSVHPDDLAKAWDLLYPLLAQESQYKFKTSRLGVMNDKEEKLLAVENISAEEKKQALEDQERVRNGMQISIYLPKNDEERFYSLLKQCEEKLMENGIRPGVMHQSDKMLGLYTSIREGYRLNPDYDPANPDVHEQYKLYLYETQPLYKDLDDPDLFKPLKQNLDHINKIPFENMDIPRQQEKLADMLKVFLKAQDQYEKMKVDPDFTGDLGTLKKQMELSQKLLMEYTSRWQKVFNKVDDAKFKAAPVLNNFRHEIKSAHNYIKSQNILIRVEKVIKRAEERGRENLQSFKEKAKSKIQAVKSIADFCLVKLQHFTHSRLGRMGAKSLQEKFRTSVYSWDREQRVMFDKLVSAQRAIDNHFEATDPSQKEKLAVVAHKKFEEANHAIEKWDSRKDLSGIPKEFNDFIQTSKGQLAELKNDLPEVEQKRESTPRR